MKNVDAKHGCNRYRLLGLIMFSVTAATAYAADPAAVGVDAPVADANTGSRAQRQLQQQFIREFGEFAGSAENAQNLYDGLRKGSRIMLSRQTLNSEGGAGTAVLQFNPAGLPMGTGSAFISAALARQQLANHGITRPEPRQIQAALNGGPVRLADPRARPVMLKGVLVQRSEGLGWSVIAKASGISLGRIISDMHQPSTQDVALAGDKAYVPVALRGSRHAPAGEAPGALRTSGRMPAPSDGLIAQ